MLRRFKLLIFICFSILSLTALSAERRFALVRRIQGIENLPDSLSRQLQTTTLQVVSKQKEYELLLSGTDTPNASIIDMVAVESEVARENNGYRIEVRLLDLRNKKLITRASRDNVREEDLIRMFQGAIESLFIPDPEKIKEPEKKPAPPPKKTTENTPRSDLLPPVPTQLNQPDQPTLDFAKRVRDLKSGTDRAIVRSVQEKKAAEASTNEPKKPTPAVSGQTTSAPKIASEKEMKFGPDPAFKTYQNQHVLMAGYDSRQVESVSYIGTTTKAQLLTIKAYGHKPFNLLDGKIAGSYDIAYSRAISSPVDLPSIYQFGIYGTFLTNNWTTSLGLQRDSTFFVNIASPGAGITPQSLTSTFLKFKGEINFDLKGRWVIGGHYGQPMMVESNYAPLKKAKKWQGSHMGISVTPPLAIMGWESSLNIDQLNLTTQGERSFALNESRFALSIRRSL